MDATPVASRAKTKTLWFPFPLFLKIVCEENVTETQTLMVEASGEMSFEVSHLSPTACSVCVFCSDTVVSRLIVVCKLSWMCAGGPLGWTPARGAEDRGMKLKLKV